MFYLKTLWWKFRVCIRRTEIHYKQRVKIINVIQYSYVAHVVCFSNDYRRAITRRALPLPQQLLEGRGPRVQMKLLFNCA